jgi:hypothetical protein
VGPALALLLAMPGGPLGYYMVSATKKWSGIRT